jgi:hypothetical protein
MRHERLTALSLTTNILNVVLALSLLSVVADALYITFTVGNAKRYVAWDWGFWDMGDSPSHPGDDSLDMHRGTLRLQVKNVEKLPEAVARPVHVMRHSPALLNGLAWFVIFLQMRRLHQRLQSQPGFRSAHARQTQLLGLLLIAAPVFKWSVRTGLATWLLAMSTAHPDGTRGNLLYEQWNLFDMNLFFAGLVVMVFAGALHRAVALQNESDLTI